MQGPVLFACLKNEGPFLLEWLAWHRHIGFGQAILFTNDCADGSAEMAAALDRAGLAIHIPNDSDDPKGPQWRALADKRLAAALALADWAMHLDLDEFLMPSRSLGDLKSLGGDAIALPWRFFGNAGVDQFVDHPITAQFQRCSPYPMQFPRQALMFKTLFRPSAFQKPGIHAPKKRSGGQPVWLNGDGLPMSAQFDPLKPILLGGNAGNDLGQVNHYALRSRDSFLVKSERGLPNRQHVPIDLSYWALRNFNDVEDTRMSAHQRSIEDGRTHLLTVAPELVTLHAAACNWHRAKASEIAASKHGAELYAGLCVTGDSRTPDHSVSARIYANFRNAYGSAA